MKSKRVVLYGLMLALAAMLVAVGVAAAQEATPEAGEESHPFLGVNVSDDDQGALVMFVMPGSPAHDADLQVGDIITAVNDAAVTASTLGDEIATYTVGDTVTLTIQRGDQSLTIDAVLVERPLEADSGDFGPRGPRGPRGTTARPFLGVTLNDSDNGVVVEDVVADSPAADAGLQSGDVITSVNDTDVTDARSAVELIRDNALGDTVTLGITRGDESLTVEVTLQEMQGNVREFFLGGIEVNYLPDEGALEIVSLDENNLLAEAGLVAGDRITAINGESIALDNLPDLLAGGMDDTVTLTVQRGDETMEIEVNVPSLLMLLPGIRGMNLGPMLMSGGGRLGLAFVTLDENTAAEYDVDVTEGALITQVQDSSPAAEAGLQEGDIVTAVNGEAVDAERTLANRLAAYEAGDTVTLDVLRDGETLQVEVTLAQIDNPMDIMPGSFDFGGRGNSGEPRGPRGPQDPNQPVPPGTSDDAAAQI